MTLKSAHMNMKDNNMWNSLSLSCFHVTAVATHLCETGCLGEQVLLLLSILALWDSHWKKIGLAVTKMKKKTKTKKPARTYETTRGGNPGIPKILYFKRVIWLLVTAFCIILYICYTCKMCSSGYTGQPFSFFGRRKGIKWVLLGICLNN